MEYLPCLHRFTRKSATQLSCVRLLEDRTNHETHTNNGTTNRTTERMSCMMSLRVNNIEWKLCWKFSVGAFRSGDFSFFNTKEVTDFMSFISWLPLTATLT